MLLLGAVFAASIATAPAPQAQAVRAVYVPAGPTFDGTLSDPAWRAAPPLVRFFEIYPGDRTAPTERTQARFLYDDRYLYVGVRLGLRRPDGLRAPFVRRDQVQTDEDYVDIDLDTLGAKRSAYLFRANRRGSKTDAYLNEARQITDFDPDFAWDVRTASDADGWTAVFRIPFSTLRLSRRGPQTWNVIIGRGVPREDKTQISSAPVARTSGCTLCVSGGLAFDDLEPARDDLLVAPSVVALVRRDDGAAARNGRRADHIRVDPSLDVKWLPYPGGAVDLTIKPDFSQVEADQPQLTANQRFAINLPEKRPFFREGTDLITTPIPVLYTRTITAPDFGVRFTSRSEGLNFTTFAANDTGKGGIVEPGFLRSDTVFPTVDSEIAYARGQGSVGMADVGGVAAFKRGADGSSNVVAGLDATWGDGVDRITGHLVDSVTRQPDRPDLLSSWRGQSLSGAAGLVEWDHTGAQWAWTAMYGRYDTGFRSWLGFVPRVGYDEDFLQLNRIFDLKGLFNQAQVYAAADLINGLDHDGREHDAYAGVTLTGLRALKIDLQAHPDAVVLDEADKPLRQRYVQLAASANPAPWAPLISLQAQVGELADFAGGAVAPGVSANVEAHLRPLDRLDLDARYGLIRLANAPMGGSRLEQTISEVSATWFLNARLYVLVDLQFSRALQRSPPTPLDRSNLSNIQLTYEVDRDLQVYAGVRSGGIPANGVDAASRQTEVYFKLTRTLHPG